MRGQTSSSRLNDAPCSAELVPNGNYAVVGDSSCNIVGQFKWIFNGKEVTVSNFLLLQGVSQALRKDNKNERLRRLTLSPTSVFAPVQPF